MTKKFKYEYVDEVPGTGRNTLQPLIEDIKRETQGKNVWAKMPESTASFIRQRFKSGLLNKKDWELFVRKSSGIRYAFVRYVGPSVS